MMRAILRRVRGRSKPSTGPAILMYHRVATPPVDPWGLSVAPARFEDQLAALAKYREVVTMNDFAAGLDAGTLPRRAVALTFDDGYRDNLSNAAPRLKVAGAPAVLFLTGDAIGRDTPFWWDELARIIMLQRGPVRYGLTLGTRYLEGDLPAMAADEAPDPGWRAWEEARTVRETTYVELWQSLQRVQPAERVASMGTLRQMAPAVPTDTDELPMDESEVSQLSAFGMSIGGHAMSHQPLTTLVSPDRRAEIEASRARCVALSDGGAMGFAFPHGDRDEETIGMVRDAGFTWACSTRSAAVKPGGFDRFDFPRVTAPDVSGAALMQILEETGE